MNCPTAPPPTWAGTPLSPLPPLPPAPAPDTTGPPEALYRDADLIALSKPAGLLSVPGRGPDKADCLLTRLRQVHPEALLVHRLDMGTSGLLIFARHLAAQRALSRAFEQRRVHKRYIAVVQGQVVGEYGSIDLPLICDWPRRPRQIVDPRDGRPALTHWQVLARDPLGRHTRLALQPVTGRSHQLRVHLQALGHPILGDELYAADPQAPGAARLLLHAERLELPHPGSGETLILEDAAPF